jgi:hypothetical protein
MAEGKPRKLRVYQAPFGFYDSVVAAPNQAAALRAWGSHQNLFAEGLAHSTTDEAAIAAALSHPETPLRRAIGSNAPFELEPSTRPKVPPASKATSKLAKVQPSKPAPPDRTRLDAAEVALRKLAEDWKREETDFRRRREQLDAEEAAARRAYDAAKKVAETTLDAARREFVKAGGAKVG